MLLRASASVSYQMESDDCQDTSGYQSRQGDQYGFQMGDKSRESLTSGPPQFGLTPPFVKDNAKAGNQHYQRHPYEQSPKTDVQSRRVPINDLLGSVRRFILKRLYVANEKRGHKQDGWEDQEPLCTGSDCGSFCFHKYLIDRSCDKTQDGLRPAEVYTLITVTGIAFG